MTKIINLYFIKATFSMLWECGHPPILKEIHILTKLGLGENSDTVWHLILLCNLPSNMEFPHKWLKTLLKTLKRNNVVVFEYYFKKYIGQQFPTKLGNSRESLNIPKILTKRHLTLLKTLKRNNVVIFKNYFKEYIGQYVGNL